MPIRAKNLLTTQDCAEELGVSDRRVLQFIEEDRLPATKIGHRWFIKEGDLKKFARIPRRPGNLTGEPRLGARDNGN